MVSGVVARPGEGEVVFFFLDKVKPQQRVQAVQARQQVIDLVRLDPAGRFRQTHMCPDAIGEPQDLGMGAALGANDGLVSTASLMVGLASSGAAAATVLTAGIAGLEAGSMVMAAGEYVSVSSRIDVERGDRAKE